MSATFLILKDHSDHHVAKRIRTADGGRPVRTYAGAARGAGSSSGVRGGLGRMSGKRGNNVLSPLERNVKSLNLDKLKGASFLKKTAVTEGSMDF